jgi:hypothetical protein
MSLLLSTIELVLTRYLSQIELGTVFKLAAFFSGTVYTMGKTFETIHELRSYSKQKKRFSDMILDENTRVFDIGPMDLYTHIKKIANRLSLTFIHTHRVPLEKTLMPVQVYRSSLVSDHTTIQLAVADALFRYKTSFSNISTKYHTIQILAQYTVGLGHVSSCKDVQLKIVAILDKLRTEHALNLCKKECAHVMTFEKNNNIVPIPKKISKRVERNDMSVYEELAKIPDFIDYTDQIIILERMLLLDSIYALPPLVRKAYKRCLSTLLSQNTFEIKQQIASKNLLKLAAIAMSSNISTLNAEIQKCALDSISRADAQEYQQLWEYTLSIIK